MPIADGQIWYEGIYKNCDNSSKGSIPNVIYRVTGELDYGQSQHRMVHITDIRSGKEVKLYGIIDGFEDGQSVAEFVANGLVREILPLDPKEPHIMNNNPSDSEIKALLYQAFRRVDSTYFSDSIGEILARRCAQQMSSGNQKNTEAVDSQIKGFATAVIALIYDNKLFVANLGDSRAIVVKKVENDLKVRRVCNWHHPSDHNERERLSKLQLNPDEVESPTRCFGDFFRKWGYKEVPALRRALGEPILADPSVHGPYTLDGTMRFLVLMNGGVVQTIMEHDQGTKVDVKVAGLVAKEFSGQPFPVVARAVLDTIARDHQIAFTRGALLPSCNKRRDVDMLVIYLAQIASDRTTPTSNCTTPEATLDSDIEEQEETEEEGCVPPYVDFSTFYSHRLKDEVLRNIEEIRNRYAIRTDSRLRVVESRLARVDEEND